MWDTDLTGFGVRCRVSGARYYFLKYRAKGRQRWVTIGRHGTPWTPHTARQEGRRLLGEVAAGHDPAAVRDSDKASLNVADLAEHFIQEHVEAKRKSSTAREYRRLLDKIGLPTLGKRRITDVVRSDIARLHHEMGKTPYQANRVLALLSKLFNWAELHGYRPDGSNPCRHVERYREQKRERFLSEAELSRLGEALAAGVREGTETMFMIAAIRLLLFTGARLGEILGLRWDYVDIERACLRLPDSKTGQKVLYLNAPALEVLAALPRVEANPYVICGKREGAHLVNLEKPWRRIRARATLDDVRLHDLRHSFASFGAAGGLSLLMIGKLLGHTQAATTERYAHLAADPVRAANEAIGERIAAAMKGGTEPGAEIAELKRQR
jgi:integrase